MKPELSLEEIVNLSLDELQEARGGMDITNAPRSVNFIDLPTNQSLDSSSHGYYFVGYSSAGDHNMSNADGSTGYSDGTAAGWGSDHGHSY